MVISVKEFIEKLDNIDHSGKLASERITGNYDDAYSEGLWDMKQAILELAQQIEDRGECEFIEKYGKEYNPYNTCKRCGCRREVNFNLDPPQYVEDDNADIGVPNSLKIMARIKRGEK